MLYSIRFIKNNTPIYRCTWLLLILCTAHVAFNQSFVPNDALSSVPLRNTTGVAVADYDGDHDLDIFIVAKTDYAAVQPNTQSRLLKNNNDGTFTDVTAAAGLTALYNHDAADPGWNYGVKMGAAWGDYDNDGFPDLFLTNYQSVQLFRNNGDGTFQEVTGVAGFDDLKDCYFTSALWWDLDRDGHLDMYITRWGKCTQNEYFHNNGDGTFTNQTAQLNQVATLTKLG